jgi:GntR family transcriptional regulator, trigonelline degradation regulator
VTLDNTSLQNQAYDAIKQLMIEGTLMPGEPVVERTLAERLGVSRVPVREAMLAMEKEGLLKKIGTKTRVVSEVSLVDILEIYDIREMIEATAAKLFAERATDELLTQLRALDVPYPSDEEEVRFHTFIVENCGNLRLAQLSKDMNIQLLQLQIRSMLERLGAMSSDWLIDEEYPHTGIVLALEARDPDRAEAAAREHMRKNRNALKRQMMGSR